MKKDRYSLGLTGYPLSYSLSPHIHTAALRALGLEGEYRLYPIPPLPQGAGQLKELLDCLRAGSLHGLNVTIPHKRSVVALVDELTLAARATGAVNTILRQDCRLVGDNTDAAGFMTDLRRHLPQEMAAGQALVLGAGGAARAVAYALLQEGWQVIVAARRFEQARQLAVEFQEREIVHGPSIEAMQLVELQSRNFQRRLALAEDGFMLLVNSTPLGMSPDDGSTPWPVGMAWPRRGLAYDLVYNPQETSWMRAARSAGLTAVGGLGMLVEQAALAFERWTGLSAPRESMALAANDRYHFTNKSVEREDV